MNNASIDKQIMQMQNLANMPPVVSQITEMLEAPNLSMQVLGDEISKDIGVASRLLKLANSSFYGFPGNISTVTQGLILMGIDAVQALIIASEVFGRLPRDLHRLTGHSLLVACVCRELAQDLSLPRSEEIATAGLLHDIGKVFLVLNNKSKYREILKEAVEKECAPRIIEKNHLGFDHVQVAYKLAEHWNLPERLIIPIRYHHNPQEAPEFKKETAIVAVANSIVNAVGGGIQIDLAIEAIDKEFFDILNLDDAKLIKISQDVLSRLDDAMK